MTDAPRTRGLTVHRPYGSLSSFLPIDVVYVSLGPTPQPARGVQSTFRSSP